MSSPPSASQSPELSHSSRSGDGPAMELDRDSMPQDAASSTEKLVSSPRPLRIYTRQHLVALSQSPLVKPPPDMPELKTWFGIENESLMNKKDEPTTPSSARERRFRREAEDGDTPSRPTFRSTLQPSQMGNFKHQSSRATDRDRDRERDRDGDKERERDIRDKEGQERLRHLSDKYDRDRLLPLSSSRNKERDAAPHLNSSNTRGQQAAPANGTSRRGETREAAKKKVGETSEDWRRGTDARNSREDRAENGRRDREDRERARSRPRDSSRPKRDSSTSRRDRDDNRREKDEPRRERVDEDDDPRRWRDDGKREERLAARRERGRGNTEEDRRWATADDRDGRYKRTTGRDRKTGNGPEDTKERDDRREKEKEPAWMDTYIPSESSPGILGGQASTGELDGIQAWKKGLKEKETKEKEAAAPAPTKVPTEQPPASEHTERGAMDEIQMFRMLMEKEKGKRQDDGPISSSEVTAPLPSKESEATVPARQREETVNGTAASGLVLKGDRPQAQVAKALTPLIDSSSPPEAASLTMKDPIVVSSGKLNPELLQDHAVLSMKGFPNTASEYQGNLSKPPSDFGPNAPFPPTGSRVLAMKNKGVPPPSSTINLQSLNGGLANIVQETPQHFTNKEALRSLAGFSPFEDPNRQSYGFEEAPTVINQANLSHRASLGQVFDNNAHPQADSNYNGSVGKGSRLAKIFESKGRELPGGPAKPMMQGGYISPPPNQNHRQEQNNFDGANGNPTHSVEALFAMLNHSSQRNNMGPPLSNASAHLSNNGGFGSQGPNLHSLQQQHLLQQHHSSNRLEPLYDSRADDRNFVPDGMVPGLRTMPPPPPRGRDTLNHFNDPLDEPMLNLQRLAQQQQQQPRNLDPLFAGPTPQLFNQHGGRHGGGLPLQSLQPHYRGGPSPSFNQTGPMSNGPQQQRLPPGLANLGGRPPHEPSQFVGLSTHPAGPQHSLHSNGPLSQQQLPFNNFNVGNNLGFNGSQGRGPGPNGHLQNSGTQQLPLGNLGHPSMDPRLSNHHHLMGLGGSGVGGNRINGGFPLQQQGPNVPNHNHLGIRPQQQLQQLQQHHLQPHGLPQLNPHHIQQQGHQGAMNTNPDLMAILMGGPHRE